MDLTPIKVPGKRKRDCSQSALAARKALNRKPGRPLKIAENVVSDNPVEAMKPVQVSKQRTLKKIKSKRKMSPLEKLPTELLERVFRFCLNLELPRSSPIIGAKLSSSTILNWTVHASFGPCWEKWYGREKVDGRLEFGDEEGKEDHSELQSAVLRCRWATLPVLLKAQDLWIEKCAKDRVFIPLYFLQDLNPVSEEEKEGQNDQERSGNTPPPTPVPPTTQEEYLNIDYAAFENTIFSSTDDNWPSTSWTTHPYLSPSVEIPHTLLLGPFTPPSLKNLFYLIKSGAKLSWHSSTSGEVALEGLRSAIRAGSAPAIHLLLWSGLLENLDVEMLCWAFRNAGGEGVGGKLRTVNQLLRLGFEDMGMRDEGRVERELADLRDEAKLEGDEEKVEFVRRLLGTRTLTGRIHIGI
ncbi:uncharacterized protein L3040_000115 [Drepanopeziza brunnea f. sp. 'multigermtubi']|uniref:uncharacterized protein n=1 Tax=Drepanopeziza brunnea f. sp. 'multigermtubi' TaxID=698441 RepID=UPI0023A0559A|nr:hypothetical protein L3040_000115 [Drepanopeziza brunnea f. sp. 'multigermtubi']